MITTKSLMRDVRKELKREYGKATVYRIAKTFNIARTTVDKWDAGGGMDDKNAIKIALFLHKDPEYVLACIHAERAKGGESYAYWQSIVHKLERLENRKIAA